MLTQQIVAGVLSLALSTSFSQAQSTFTANDLPTKFGDFYRAYVTSSETDVSQLIGAKGGPQRWDFSQAKIPGEEVRRIDIVAPADGGHGAPFGNPQYAERTTHEDDGQQSWSYYRILAAAQGRAYYGFFDPVSNATDPLTVFDDPTIDLPGSIVYNQTWHREVDFQDVVDPGFGQVNLNIHFIANAVVDAYGTVVLPELGELPALRVNEEHTYETYDTTFGLPLGSQEIRTYYWLVKGIGPAVQIVSKTDPSSMPAEEFQIAARVLRTFASSNIKTVVTSRSVTNLLVSFKGKDLFLRWDRATSAATYQVQTTESLNGTGSWKDLLSSEDNFLFDPLDPKAGAKFYRVLYAQ